MIMPKDAICVTRPRVCMTVRRVEKKASKQWNLKFWRSAEYIARARWFILQRQNKTHPFNGAITATGATALTNTCVTRPPRRS